MTKFTMTFSIPALKKNQEGKKELVGMPRGWTNFKTPNDCVVNPNHKVKCVMTGKINNICVIDCDTHDAYYQLLKKYPILENTYTVKTQRGFHIYVNYDPKVDFRNSTNKSLNIDVKTDGGMVFGEGSKTEFGTEYTLYKDLPLVDAPREIWCEICNPRTAKPENPNEPPKVNRITSDVDIDPCCLAVLENIDILFLTNYDDWIRIVWAIKNTFSQDGYIIAKELSQKCHNYGDGKKFEEIWRNGRDGNTWGTIVYYSKLSNENEHYKILLNHKPLTEKFGDFEIAECLLEYIQDDIFLKEGEWYLYDEDTELWSLMKDSDDWSKFKYKVRKVAVKLYQTYNDKLCAERNALPPDSDAWKNKNEVIKIYQNNLNGISKLSKNNDISTALKQILCHRKVDIELDTDPLLFAFEDYTIDLRTGTSYTRNKYDYITMSCGYKYKKPTTEQYEKMCEIIDKIFPDPEIKKCYASILFSCLTGIRPEKFIICNGCGRNGKGVINELLASVLGGTQHYYNKGNTCTLTKPLTSGANAEIAGMHKKRANISTEPEKGSDGLNVEAVKKLTGDDEVNARKLYSNNTICILWATQILEANKIPTINGHIGMAEIARFVVVMFNSIFIKGIKEPEINDNHIGNKYPMDEELKQDNFKKTYRYALFEWILNNAPREIYIPDVVKQASQDYLLSCDDIIGSLLERIEYTGYDKDDENKQDFITIKDLFQIYKSTESYINKTKAEKRKYNYDAFTTDIRTNQKFAIHFKDKYKGKGKARDKGRILIGWRLKMEEDEVENDPEGI